MNGIISETHLLPAWGPIPNNPFLPVCIHRNIISLPAADKAAFFEKIFRKNKWIPAWRYTIYDFPHYHSTAHEVIGIFQGRADVQLGGPAGIIAHLGPGDVLVLPAGVCYQRLSGTTDFEGVGAYPLGQTPDLKKCLPIETAQAEHDIQKLPLPLRYPLHDLVEAPASLDRLSLMAFSVCFLNGWKRPSARLGT